MGVRPQPWLRAAEMICFCGVAGRQTTRGRMRRQRVSASAPPGRDYTARPPTGLSPTRAGHAVRDTSMPQPGTARRDRAQRRIPAAGNPPGHAAGMPPTGPHCVHAGRKAGPRIRVPGIPGASTMRLACPRYTPRRGPRRPCGISRSCTRLHFSRRPFSCPSWSGGAGIRRTADTLT